MLLKRTQQAVWFGIGCVLMLSSMSVPASAQLVVKSEDVTFKFGLQGQMWGDWTQNSTAPQNYQQNMYLRRARIILSADVGSDITVFVQTDDPKLGITPKALNTGFVLQDAFIEWRPTNVFMVDGGLFIAPFSRNALQSTSSYLTLDIDPLAAIDNSATQSSAMRDAGFQFKGFFANDRLQYRVGAFDGERDSNGQNSLRTVGFLQYDFFDREKGYVFAGTKLGKGKLAGVQVGAEKQSSFRGYSSSAFAALPVNQGDEIAGQFEYFHYDGRSKFTSIANQNDYMLEGAYYIHQAKVQPFVKYDSQNFVLTANAAKDINRVGFGANYYIHGQNLKWTMQYLRALPQNGATAKATNEFTVQLQFFYF